MRTTLDLDATVLAELKERRKREGKSLGQVASELLARALAEPAVTSGHPLAWAEQAMTARVDLEDRDAVARILDGPA